jgi:ABC-type branched-subunit amino acid transport system ATPase component
MDCVLRRAHAAQDSKVTRGQLATNLQAQGISISFSGLRAIENVDLRLDHGEILGLIGPNGAGKSTLVNIMSGYLTPDRGRVELGGTDITGRPAHRLCRLGLTRTFQSVRLFGRLTVAENIEVGALANGQSRRKARAVVRELFAEHDLSAVADVESRSLPFGLERRVALARALATDPAFLLLDEPAAGLDDRETDELRAMISSVRETRGCGLLVIEHDMGLIMKLCDRVQVINSGRTISLGTPDEVRNDPEVRTAYLGPEVASAA